MEIAKLFARIGVKADSGQLASFTKGLGQASSGLLKLAGLAAGPIGAAMALKKFTSQAMQTALSLQNFSAETGVSAEALQRWKAVADQVSGSGHAVEAAITSIAINREALKLGEGNLSPYQLLGIDPFQDPIKVLEDLRKETARLPQAMKANIIQQMGLSSDLIPMLELTNEQFAEMSGRAYVMPQSAINGLNSTRRSLTELGQAGKYFQGLIATGLAPGLKKFTDNLNRWIRQNPQVIEGIKKIGDGVGRALVAISRAASMINTLVKNTIGWKNALIGLVAIIGVMNASLLLSPIGLFTAAIIALLLILEDLYVYSQGDPGGENSLFGYLMENSEGFRNAMEGLFGVFKTLKELLGDVKELFFAFIDGDWSKIDEIRKKWGLLGDALFIVVQALELLRVAVNNFSPETIGNTKTAWGKWFEEGGGGAQGVWNVIKNQGIYEADALRGFLGGQGYRPMEGSRSAIELDRIFNKGDTTTVNQTNNFDIRSTDPVEAGREVSDRITPALQRVNAGGTR